MKRFYLFLFPVALVLLLAACGSSTSTGGGTGYGNTGTTPTTAATTGSTPTAAANATGGTIRTASATVNGKTVTLLTNAQGLTLYYFMPDTATTSACTGGCTSNWPPLLSKSVPGASGLSGKITLQTNANGQQVTYNGHPLYTYSGDTSPGQTSGEGLGNKWYVATNDLVANKGSSAGGYGSAGY
jgi:predicted lipoprotein with Yx(FWY)xxD motif